MKISAVTALYDLGREAKDGRSIADYAAWLNETLKLPIPFTVFLDPAIKADEITLKATDRLVRVAKEDFPLFRHRDLVAQICAQSPRVNRKDLTFRLPDYGVLVMSKFDMIRRAAEASDADGILWLDAGLSRFFETTSNLRIDADFALKLAASRIAVSVNRPIVKAFTWRRLPSKVIGTSSSLINAGDIFVRREFASSLADQIRAMIEDEWLPAGLWDNEQVAMGYVLLRQPQATPLMGVVLGNAGLAKSLFGVATQRQRTPRLWRTEAAIRRLRSPNFVLFPPYG